jgi:cytochrome c oxidase assembly protein subunit 15
MRGMLGLALALVLLVALCSATLRLASTGVGCTPWPGCYAQANAAAPADETVPAWQHTLRLTHRVSATVAGLVFVFIVAFGFSRWSLSQRLAGASLWVLAVALALVGRITPSQLPAVVLANLLGGHLLLAALGWLLVPAAPLLVTAPRPALARWLGWPLVVGVLLSLASGALVSARGAVVACADGCGPADWPAALAAWNLWQPNAAWPSGGAMQKGVQSMHVAWGTLVVVALGMAAWRLRGRAGIAAGAAATLALAAAVLGLGGVQRLMPLPTAAAHSVLAGLTLAGATVMWRCIASRAGRNR